MRVLVLAMILMMCQVFAVANSTVIKTSYIMVPEKNETESYNMTDLNIVGLGEKGTEYSWKLGVLEENEIGVIAVDELEYYRGTKLLKLTMLVRENENIKVAMTYKIKGEDEYVILGSERAVEVINNDERVISKIQANYDNEDTSSLNLIKNDYSYTNFPGHEIEENVILKGARVGNKKYETSEIPSNIIIKIEASDGDEADAKGVNILPSASWSQFHITTKDDSASYGLKNKSNNHQNYVKLSGTVNNINAKEVFITPKNENSGEGGYTLYLNNRLITLEKGTLYKFYGDLVASVINYGGNKWVLQMTGEVTLSDPTLPEQAKGDDVYIIESEGLVYDVDVNMTSGNEQERRRISDVNIGVLESGESRFEIKSIKE